MEKRKRKRAARRKATKEKKQVITLKTSRTTEKSVIERPKPKVTKEHNIILREFFENRRKGVFDLDKIGSESQVLMH